jgi:hypothetical protein
MKNKYNTYRTYNDYDGDYKDGNYIIITDYVKEYGNYYTSEYKKTETKEERLAREKAEKRNSKIDQILG